TSHTTPAPPKINTLSLHDALPISGKCSPAYIRKPPKNCMAKGNKTGTAQRPPAGARHQPSSPSARKKDTLRLRKALRKIAKQRAPPPNTRRSGESRRAEIGTR